MHLSKKYGGNIQSCNQKENLLKSYFIWNYLNTNNIYFPIYNDSFLVNKVADTVTRQFTPFSGRWVSLCLCRHDFS